MIHLLALSPGLLAVPAWRHALEGSMVLHMLLQFPWLIASGMAVAHVVRHSPRWAAIDRLDAHGLLGATTVTAVLAFWMLPVALDLSLLSPPVQVAKYLSLWTCGLLLARTWTRWRGELLAFVTGNLAWMTATAGLLFGEADTRLCLSYLMDEQRWTGHGLMAYAVLAGAFTIHRLAAPIDSADAQHRQNCRASPPGRPHHDGPPQRTPR